MGASSFLHIIKEVGKLNEVFEKAVKEAEYDYGHAGYTGTIAEKNDVILRSKTPMTIDEAEKFACTDMEGNDKWGPAFAVPLCKEKEDKTIIGYLFYGYASY